MIDYQVPSHSLARRHALITGGAGGIGHAVATALAEAGADITLLGRDESRLRRKRAEFVEGGIHGRVEVVVADLEQPDQIAAALTLAVKQIGPVSILINNAGIAPSAPIAKQSLASWNQVLSVDLTAAFLTSQQLLPGMIEGGWGRIVNVASTAGLIGYRYVAAYCAAKHGLIGLTRALALETARTGVTVNAVCPGFTDTALVAGAVGNIVAKTGRTAEAARADLAKVNPQGRLVEPNEVAASVLYLCHESSAAITGQSIVIAGGEVMN